MNQRCKALAFCVPINVNVLFNPCRMCRLLEGGVYFTFPFPNAAFIREMRLKEQIPHVLLLEKNIPIQSQFGLETF